MANEHTHLLGQNGSIDINTASGTLTYTGTDRPVAIQALNGLACTFTAIVDDLNTGDLVTSLSVGQIVYGKFSSIDVSGGTLRAYKG